jgi:hypothetical protein
MEKADGELLAPTLEGLDKFASDAIVPGMAPSDILALDDKSKTMTIESYMDIDTNLFSLQFAYYGSLYFREDVPEGLRGNRLYAEGTPEDEFSSRYCIGPICEPSFWRPGMEEMDIDRGPCK